MTRVCWPLCAALLAPVYAHAQTVERFSLQGERVGIHNVAGNVTVEGGPGDAVIVEVTRGGNDAKRLLIQQLTDDGRASLCIVYPNERIIYRPRQGNPRWDTNTNSAGECRGGVKGMFSDRKVEVRSRGIGVEAWADVRIIVPPGHDVKVWNVAGELRVNNVVSSLELHSATAPIETRGTRGGLNVHSASGPVTVSNHDGDVGIDVSSSDIRLDSATATSVALTSGTGNLSGSVITTQALRLHDVTGTIHFAALTARTVRAEGGGGAITLGFAANVDSLAAETGPGVLTFSFPTGLSAEVELESVSGAVTLDFPVQPPHSKRGELRGTIGDGHAHIYARTGSGDIHILRSRAAQR